MGEEGRGGEGPEAGYNMVVLIVAITVLNIAVAAMLPLWSTQIRREKEEELIFRGFQYAEAIRVFHRRFQRYPNKLEELMEVKPRSIRQLWKDPMTEDGKWGLIFQNQPDVPDPNQDQNKPPEEVDPNGRAPGQGEVVQVGPIIGVRSRSGEKSMIVLFGRERYNEWQFREDLFTRLSSSGIGPGSKLDLEVSTRWMGRPERFQSQIPGGTMPDGSTPPTKPPRRPPNRP